MDRKTGDIRMRGFSERSELDAVLLLIEQRLEPLPPAPVPVAESLGRVLADDQTAGSDVPGFDRSAMDGYALRGEETFGATPLTPLSFRLLGEARPGHPFSGAVGSGEAVRIMTGAPLPDGADAVLMAEMSLEKGGLLLAQGAVAPGKNVGLRGEDIRVGVKLFGKGHRLRPQDAAVLASVGLETVAVVGSPTVSILITGDELLPPGSRPEPPFIVDTNSIILAGLVARDGGVARQPPIIPDDRDQVRQALVEADSDLILLSGGSSVGTEDHAPTLVMELGELLAHGIAMRPASPAGFGLIGRTPVFLIPGNPVSCLAAYEFLAGPALRRLGGRSMEWPHRRLVLPLARKISSAIGRVDYVRVRIEGGAVLPLAISGASILSSTTRADGAVIVPAASEGYAEGTQVSVLLY